ncbi:MAG: dihydroorotate dehydrogenase electron transfer subunit [Lachnospiraceae bacterium]|nr:dihydroorotate dehydrogenase electron transfer subunit [Lachnospiraceae bacterium]
MSSEKAKRTLTVTACEALAAGVYSLTLQYREGEAPKEVRPGQFVGVYSKDSARILPRPISICGWDQKKRELRLVFRVVGQGTEEFSKCQLGESLDVLGILGNGYDLAALSGRKVLLLGGGIGAPPLLELARQIHAENEKAGSGSITAVLGYRTDDLFLEKEFASYGDVVITTDDGTAGFHGNVVGAVRDKAIEADVICACGPMPMLRGVRALALERDIPCYLSLEERMACGVGACLGCVTKTAQVDGHSHVKNARICTEGPVFEAREVLI